MYNIHISDIRSFRSCRRRWNWSSGLRDNLEPAVPYSPFFVGRAVHHCLEHHYKEHRSVWESLDEFLANEESIAGHLWQSERETWDTNVGLISDMLRHYLLWVQVDPSSYRDETLEFIDLEIPFSVPSGFSEDFNFEGRFDGLVRHIPTDTYWIWEVKTARSITELTKSLDNDEQAGTYIFATQQLRKVKVEGVLYNIMRKKAPTHPQVLTNGMLSKSKKIDTTPFAYVADVKAHHGDVTWDFIKEYYGDFLDGMSIGDNGFFARWPVKRSQSEIEMLMGNLYATAKEMVNPDTVCYPAPSWLNCNFCMFRAPCLAMNKGADYQGLLEAEFQQRVKAESLREVEENES